MRTDGGAAARFLPSPVWPLLVALVAGATYVNSTGNGFALDDVPLVRDDPRLASPASIPRLFLEPYWARGGEASGLYRPVTNASFALNRAIAGIEPAAYHWGNVLLHAAVSALVWLAARRAGVHYGTALAAGLLFAVHPIHTEAVANIAGRAELLAAVGVLAAWLAHRRAVESAGAARAGWAAAAASSWAFGLFSKESAIVAPALFWLDDGLRREGRPLRLAGTVHAGYAIAAGVYGLLRVRTLGDLGGVEDAAFIDNPAAAAGAWPRVATAFAVLARYAWLLIWPARLSSDYSFDAIPVVRSAGDPVFLAGAAIAAVAVGALPYGARRSRTVALAAGIGLLFWLPSSNLLFATGTQMAERLLYLPSLGACLLAGHLWAGLFEGSASRGSARARRALLVLGLAAVVLALGARSFARNPNWESNATLALRDVETTPRSAKLHLGAAIVLHQRDDRRDAETHYRRALDIHPDYAQAHYNLGVLLASEGRSAEAIEHLSRAASLSPANPRPLEPLAGLLERAGRSEEALRAYDAALRLEPSNHALRLRRARALAGAGRTAEARRALEALLGEPGVPGALRREAAARLASMP